MQLSVWKSGAGSTVRKSGRGVRWVEAGGKAPGLDDSRLLWTVIVQLGLVFVIYLVLNVFLYLGTQFVCTCISITADIGASY